MAPFKLNEKDVVLVKPSKPTPSSLLSLSTLDNIHDPNMLCQTLNVYQKSQNHIDIGDDPASLIKEALSKALFYYYPLAGKLIKNANGKIQIKCEYNNNNGEGFGVPFLEAIADCKLSSLEYLNGNDIEVAKQLVFEPVHLDDESGYKYGLGFKVTKFLCGGFTVGMGLSHALCDGVGACQFYRAIVELASGKSEPSVKPVWERERLLGSITDQPLPHPMDDASAALSPFLPTTSFVYQCFKVDSESIRKLKISLTKEFGDDNNESMMIKERITSFESLAAYVWRSRTRALKLNNDGKTLMLITVGVRRHMKDQTLPEGYYGNAIVNAYVVLKVSEINERPLSHVVKHIKKTKNDAFTSDFITKSIDTFETRIDKFNVEGTGAYFFLTDWKHLGLLEKMDFGKNVLVNALPCHMFGSVGSCVFAAPSNLEDSSMKDEVRVFISLPSAAMPKFREEMEALSVIKEHGS